MDADSSNSSGTASSFRAVLNDLPMVCRFCFSSMEEDVPRIDVFSSRIGSDTILEVVQNYFPVLKETTYEQYLNGRHWTSNHLEVTNFELHSEKHGLGYICPNCLEVIIQSYWFSNQLRSHNLPSMAVSTLCTLLGQCTLVDIQGDAVTCDKIVPNWTYDRNQNADELANFRDACIFCFQHNTSLLFELFLSKILDSSMVDVIKACSRTYKKEDIYEKVHLLKSCKKAITVVDFQWNYSGETNVAPRQICADCAWRLIKFKVFIERIRKTNEALPFMALSGRLDGSIEINIPVNIMEDILSRITFISPDHKEIPASQVFAALKKKIRSPKEDSATPTPIELKSIFCKYCYRYIFDCNSIEEHIVKCLKEDVVFAVQVHNRALCEHCLGVEFRKKETLGRLPMESFKNCSVCKMSLYQSRDDVDENLTLEEYLTKYF